MEDVKASVPETEFLENVCHDCNMHFETIAEYANHKESFCINSDYFDPVKLQKQLASRSNKHGSGGTSVGGVMTFKQVKHYLKVDDTETDDRVEEVGKVTLGSLRSQFQQNEAQMDSLRKQVKRQRQQEKAEEVRALKVKQQKARMKKKQEEDEIKEMMLEVESRREAELRARIERESIKKEIRDLDNTGLVQLQAESKRDLAELAKKKEALLAKEQEALKEIEALEKHVMEQEKEFREQQRAMQDSLEDKYGDANSNDRKEQVRQRHMDMSKERGQQAAALQQQRASLLREREEMEAKLKGVINIEEDSLSNMVNTISLQEQSDRLAKMKDEQKQATIDEKEALLALDKELESNEAYTNSDPDYSQTKDLENFLDNWIKDDVAQVDKEAKTKVALEQVQNISNPKQKQEDQQETTGAATPRNESTPQEPSPITPDSLDEEVAQHREPKKSPRPPPQQKQQSPEQPQQQYPYGQQPQVPGQTLPVPGQTFPFQQPQQTPNIYSSSQPPQQVPLPQQQPQQSAYPFVNPYLNPPNVHPAFAPPQQVPTPYAYPGGAPGPQPSPYQPYPMATGPQIIPGAYPPYYSHNPYQGAVASYPNTSYPHTGPPFGMNYGPGHSVPNMMGYPHPMQAPVHPDPQQQLMLMQQEMENARLQHELEHLMSQKESNELSREKERMNRMMNTLHSKLDRMSSPNDQKNLDSEYHPAASERNEDENGGEKAASKDDRSEFWKNHKRDLDFVHSLPDTSELRQMQLEHLEEMARMRFEMDRLEKEQKLEAMRLGLEKQKEEKAKQLEHEKWMADQKRQLMALRMRKVLAKEQPANFQSSATAYTAKPYDPEAGFVVFWDYVLNIPPKCEQLQITYAFFEGTLQRTRPKIIRHRECEEHGPKFKRCVFATKRTFEKVASSLDLRLVVELSSVLKGAPGPGQAPKVLSIGWTALDLFTIDATGASLLKTGMLKLPVKSSGMPDMSKQLAVLPANNEGTMRAFIRIVHAEDVEQGESFSVDPEITAGSYHYPNVPTAPTQHQQQHQQHQQQPQYHQAQSADPSMHHRPSDTGSTNAASEAPRHTIANTNIYATVDPTEANPSSTPVSIEALKFNLDQVEISSPESMFSGQELYISIYLIEPSQVNALEIIQNSANLLWQSPSISILSNSGSHVPLQQTPSFSSSSSCNITSTSSILIVFQTASNAVVWGSVPLSQVQEIEKLPLFDMKVSSNIQVVDSSSSCGNLLFSSASTPTMSFDNVVEKDNPHLTDVPPEAVEDELENAAEQESAIPFYEVDHSKDVKSKLFVAGDGFDIYVDGARFLPDNVNISKATVLALTSDMTLVEHDESTSAYAELESPVYDPLYNLQVDYRQDRFNPTLTLAIRIDAVDALTKEAMIVGYAVIAAFLEPETQQQPTKTNAQDIVLNQGCFQLPLAIGLQPGNVDVEFNDKACDNFLRLPCSTILVRIVPAAKSEDGLSTLSKKDFAQSEWIPRQLVHPRPEYSSKVYHSMSCKPSATEITLYQLRLQRANNVATQTAVTPIIEAQEEITDMKEWLEKVLGSKPKESIDVTRIACYQPEFGFKVAIDGLYNTPTKKLFYKAITCLSPPAPFYQDPKLTEDVQFTTSMDWKSAQYATEFLDGFFTYRNIFPDEHLVLLIDIRGISRHQKTGKYTITPFGWACLPILNAADCIRAGSFQLPVFQGSITKEILEHEQSINQLIEAETSKKKGLIKYMDGVSVFVRLEDVQIPNTQADTAFIKASNEYLPKKIIAKYKYDTKKLTQQKQKAPFTKLLQSKMSEKAFEKEMNVAFAEQMDITHYSF